MITATPAGSSPAPAPCTTSAEESLRLRTITEQLFHLSTEHIRIEEGHVFPEAASHLDREALLAVGSEFRHRRF